MCEEREEVQNLLVEHTRGEDVADRVGDDVKRGGMGCRAAGRERCCSRRGLVVKHNVEAEDVLAGGRGSFISDCGRILTVYCAVVARLGSRRRYARAERVDLGRHRSR